MLRLLLYTFLAVTVYVTLFYLETYQPEMLTNLLIQVDVFGLTRAASMEQDRLAHINGLSIPYEEKKVLISRTVFMGATREMVKLALGEPRKAVERMWDGKQIMLTYYIYFLPDDKRPTILVFQEDKLVNAYKGSALDVGN
jgi:hypothetical protein